jgi:hypothetical protein
VAGNEIHHNNTAGFSALWEAGGAKWGEAVRLTVRDNSVHHNRGPGLWTHINSIHVLYERNSVHANAGHGIYHEISYDATIRDNRVTTTAAPTRPRAGWRRDPRGRLLQRRGLRQRALRNANAVILVQQARPE